MPSKRLKAVMVLILTFVLCLHVEFASCQQQLRVLLVGNTYTAANNLPAMLLAIFQNAEAANGSYAATVDSFTSAADLTAAAAKIQDSTDPLYQKFYTTPSWTHVVLQENPVVSALGSAALGSTGQVAFSASVDAMEIFNLHARSLSPPATVVLFENWGRQFGLYDQPAVANFSNFAAMQNAINSSITQYRQVLVNSPNTTLPTTQYLTAPAGEAFREIFSGTPGSVQFSGLFAPADNTSLPSTFGTYLAAATLFTTLTKTSAVGSTFLPAGVTANQQTYLATSATAPFSGVALSPFPGAASTSPVQTTTPSATTNTTTPPPTTAPPKGSGAGISTTFWIVFIVIVLVLVIAACAGFIIWYMCFREKQDSVPYDEQEMYAK